MTTLISVTMSGVLVLVLEPRKERNMRWYRTRWDFNEDVWLLLTMANALRREDMRVPADVRGENRVAIVAEIDRIGAQMDAATVRILDRCPLYAQTWSPRHAALISRYAGAVRAVQLSPRTRQAKTEILAELTSPLHRWLFGRRAAMGGRRWPWRPLKKRALAKALDHFDEINREPPPVGGR